MRVGLANDLQFVRCRYLHAAGHGARLHIEAASSCPRGGNENTGRQSDQTVRAAEEIGYALMSAIERGFESDPQRLHASRREQELWRGRQ